MALERKATDREFRRRDSKSKSEEHELENPIERELKDPPNMIQTNKHLQQVEELAAIDKYIYFPSYEI